MTRTLTFSGGSDDLFCVEERSDGKPCGGDETSPSSEDSTGGYKVANQHAGLFVVGTYAPHVTEAPCWSVGVMPLDEDVALPDWPMRFETAKNGYSSALVIEVPEDAYVQALATPRD